RPRAAICRTMPVTPPTPGTPPRAGCRTRSSGRPRNRRGSPPGGFLDPEDDRALEDITLHRQLRHLATQPHQLSPLIGAQPAVTGLTPVPVHRYPVGQGAFLDPQVPSHRSDRLACLPHDAHRALAELRLELASRLRHRPSLPSKAMSPRYEGKPSQAPRTLGFPVRDHRFA